MRSKLRAAQPNPTKAALLRAQNVNEIWLQRQKRRRQILRRRSITHHTLITRCPPSQPLCNLWTSLLDFYVRRACAVTFCTCSERRSSYPDIFSSTQGAVRPKRLLCWRQRLRSSMIARREARYFIDTNLKCAICYYFGGCLSPVYWPKRAVIRLGEMRIFA